MQLSESLFEFFFGPIVSFVGSIGNFLVQVFNVGIMLPLYASRFFESLYAATQFPNYINWISWIPEPIRVLFFTMVIFSIACAIFGRIR